MDEQLRQLGLRCRDARKRAGLSQQQLADAANVSLGVISNLETGKTLPQPANRTAIARALGEDIFEDDKIRRVWESWRPDSRSYATVLGKLLNSLTPERSADLVGEWMSDLIENGGTVQNDS